MGGMVEKRKRMPRVRPGDMITATTYNRLAAAIEEAFRQIANERDTYKRNYERVVCLNEDVDLDDNLKEGQSVAYEDAGSGGSFVVNTTDLIGPIFDYTGGLFFSGEYVATRWQKGGGQHMIKPGVRIHIGTVKTQIPIEGSGSGKVLIQEMDGAGAFSDSTMGQIDAFGWGNTAIIAVDAKVWCYQHPQNRKWVAMEIADPGGCNQFGDIGSTSLGGTVLAEDPSGELCGWADICAVLDTLTRSGSTSYDNVIVMDDTADSIGDGSCEVAPICSVIHNMPGILPSTAQQLLVLDTDGGQTCTFVEPCDLFGDLGSTSLSGQVLAEDPSGENCGWVDICKVLDTLTRSASASYDNVIVLDDTADAVGDGNCEVAPLCSVLHNMPNVPASTESLLILDTTSGTDCTFKEPCDLFDAIESTSLSGQVLTEDPSGENCGWADICAVLKTVAGYDNTKKQALTHDTSGNCSWVDIASC